MGNKKTFLLIILLYILSTVPFLGLTEFNTKGEPRESIVALSMLQKNDWILPTNNGGDIAYKPPFFHWCIAAISSLEGNVSLFSSRLPSAAAIIILLAACYLFYARKSGWNIALLTTLITFTSFEMHRAAFACRVDMLMTTLIVLSLFSIFKWNEKGMKGIPLAGILLMGLSTLTKGPVGIVLPSVTMGCYSLLKGEKLWTCIWKYSVNGLLALVLPAVWYIMAYNKGGEEFLNLVAEENFGRFFGRMSYASHEGSIAYNFMSVIAGMLPWTLVCLLSLFYIRHCNLRIPSVKKVWKQLKGIESYKLFSLLSIAVIFIFYCIPKSKRSVYLMPIYPFTAYFLACYLKWLVKNYPQCIKIFGWIIASAGFLLLLAFSMLKYGFVPDSIAGTGKHAVQIQSFIKALESIPLNPINLFLVILPAYTIWKFTRHASDKKASFRMLYSVIAIIISINISLDGVYLPAGLSSKSDKNIIKDIENIITEENLKSYIQSPMLRFYTLNWYMDDRITAFNPEKDNSGYLIVGEKDSADLKKSYGQDFLFKKEYQSPQNSCDIKQKIILIRYERKTPPDGKNDQEGSVSEEASLISSTR